MMTVSGSSLMTRMWVSRWCFLMSSNLDLQRLHTLPHFSLEAWQYLWISSLATWTRRLDVMVVEVKIFTFTWLKDFLQVMHLKFSLCFPAAVSSPEVFSPAPQSRLCLASFAAEEDWTPQPSHRSPGSWGVVLRSVGPFGFGLNLHTRDELRSHENSNSFIVAASDPFTLLIVTGI